MYKYLFAGMYRFSYNFLSFSPKMSLKYTSSISYTHLVKKSYRQETFLCMGCLTGLCLFMIFSNGKCVSELRK